MTTTTRPRLTSQQITALRAMLAATGSVTERIDAGIDACRSSEYHQRIAAYLALVTIRREAHQAHDDVELPVTERVPGATDLRAWLQTEAARIATVRTARAQARHRDATGTVRARAERGVRRAVRAAYDRCDYRRAHSAWAGGNHTVSVCLGGTVGAAGESERVWSDNGKWSGNDSSHRLCVSLRWRLDVERQDIAVVSDLLTLAANPAEGLRAGEQAYTAVWVRQGRGVGLEVGRGIIYRRTNGGWSHYTSLAAARRAHRVLSGLEDRA